MEELENLINQKYSTISKNDVLKISLEVCYKLMKKQSGHLQENVGVWNKETILLSKNKFNWYSNINSGLLEFTTVDRNFDTLLEAKSSISLLLMYIQIELEDEFIKTDLENQQRIINQIYIPHLLLKWSLNNL
ncbi:hypothetical protein [Epilithonimonas sp.]|uniref:hypothetical protein n=1 Tax=Epilithonimonas sp. TaxID=2894511 RepID=UPI002FDEA608